MQAELLAGDSIHNRLKHGGKARWFQPEKTCDQLVQLIVLARESVELTQIRLQSEDSLEIGGKFGLQVPNFDST